MSLQITPLVESAVSWMYGSRLLLERGYSGEDPGFTKAKAAFIKQMQIRWPEETEESLLQAFETALNMI
jgi:hypothetical protein